MHTHTHTHKCVKDMQIIYHINFIFFPKCLLVTCHYYPFNWITCCVRRLAVGQCVPQAHCPHTDYTNTEVNVTGLDMSSTTYSTPFTGVSSVQLYFSLPKLKRLFSLLTKQTVLNGKICQKLLKLHQTNKVKNQLQSASRILVLAHQQHTSMRSHTHTHKKSQETLSY